MEGDGFDRSVGVDGCRDRCPPPRARRDGWLEEMADLGPPESHVRLLRVVRQAVPEHSYCDPVRAVNAYHYEYFDYIEGDKIHQFTPDSDCDYTTFKKIIRKE